MDFTESFSMLDAIPKEQRLCFTGHRPEKLPKGRGYESLLETLYYYIDRAVERGYRLFLDGMADGIDFHAAEYLIRKRKEMQDIRIIGVQPFENYEEFFRSHDYDPEHLRLMRESFDEVIVMKGKYELCSKNSRKFFYKRNQFLVDHASAMIAVCSLGRSGSKQTLDYALKKKLAVCRIEANPGLLYTPNPDQWPVEKSNF